MINLLYSAKPADHDAYVKCISQSLHDLGVEHSWGDLRDDPASIDYIIYAPDGAVQDFGPYCNTKLVQSTWAGVDAALHNKTLFQPLARMVEPGLTAGMVDYVVGHCYYYHLQNHLYFNVQPGQWRDDVTPPLSQDRVVGVLGLGVLGQACAQALAGLGFNVIGWSRAAKQVAGVACYCGTDGLRNVLAQADILVLLLPATLATRHIINADHLAQTRPGVVIINPGRGDLIDDDALLDALNGGHVANATLDTFCVEPLPKEHPYWHHPRVKITPHIASTTRLKTSAVVAALNIARSARGQTPLYLVDRTKGY